MAHRFKVSPEIPNEPAPWHTKLRLTMTRLLPGIAALLAFLIMAYITLALVPRWLVHGTGLTQSELLKARNDARSTVVQVLAATAVISGLFFTARSYAASLSAQITERFSKAIGQLGDPEVNVRIGALYALDRISRDSRRDYATVVQVLVRFIRESASSTADSHGIYSRPEQNVSGDLQAALALLGNRVGVSEETERLQLAEVVLPSVELSSTQLDHVDLCHAHLDGASFSRASLRGAELSWASLHNAFLTNADMRGAALFSAHLEGSFLRGSDLRRADLGRADLSGAALSPVVDSDGEILVAPARLEGASFREAVLAGTDLRGVDLREVSGLTADQLAGAVTDEATKLPADLIRTGGAPAPTPQAGTDTEEA
jgi:uncharacterized protein YjbI with pentapeptide repeats